MAQGFKGHAFFLSCKTNARVKLAKTGHSLHSSTLVVICVVRLLFVLFCVLFVCKCVLLPGDNPMAVAKYIMLYHVVSNTGLSKLHKGRIESILGLQSLTIKYERRLDVRETQCSGFSLLRDHKLLQKCFDVSLPVLTNRDETKWLAIQLPPLSC
jgi:hypothetical protein